MDAIWTILQFVIIFSILMILHETGHYLMCRLLRIPVEEYGLGFPPRVLTLFRWQGTEFTLNAIPFGAFVKPLGEMDRNIPDGMANANPWKKLGVYLGGPIMNMAFGLILMIVLFFQLGAPDTSKVILTAIIPQSPAEASGLQVGDQILAVNGIPTNTIEEMQTLIQQNLGIPVDLTILRGQDTLMIRSTPRLNPPPNQGALGVQLGYPYHKITLVGAVIEGTRTGYEQVKGFILLPSRLIQGSVSQEESRLVGIKGIYDMYSSAGELDAQASNSSGGSAPVFRLYIIATVSLALGLTNLLPIPALDGGRILLVLPELILRRRIPQKVETYLVSISFMALILLMIFITYQDIVHPVALP